MMTEIIKELTVIQKTNDVTGGQSVKLSQESSRAVNTKTMFDTTKKAESLIW